MIEIVGVDLTQWDVDREVSISTSNITHVHFANKGDSRAVVLPVEESKAPIPNYLLQTGKQLCVYAVANGVTVESKVFSVRNRERPENYVYEDDQRNYIYELIQSAEAATAEAERVAEELITAKERGDFKGDTGEKGDKGEPGHNIDDNTIGADAWSSKNIVDKLCPAFEKTGTIVTCEPVEGYPLTVTGGDIIARCGKNLYDESNTVKGEKIYADSDDTKGETRFGVVVYLPKGKYTIHAERTATEGYSNDYIYVVVLDRWTNINLSTSSVKPVQKGNTYAVQVELDNNQCLFFYNGLKTTATLDNTVEMFGRYNLQIEVGAVATPWEPFKNITTFNGDEQIPSLVGVNTLWHDIGDNVITVTGRADPVAMIEKLTNAIIALGSNI